jgi:hypothetical protein
MAATYPTAVKSWTPKVNNSDIVIASDVNTLYDEVNSVEAIIGSTPNVSSWSGTTFDSSTTDWSTVKARIANIETGVNIAYSDRVKVTGSSTILPSAIGVKGLVVKATSGQTANLQEWQDSSSSVVTSIGKDGWLISIDGGSA